MIIIAKYLGPVVFVAAARMKLNILTNNGPVMCQYRSPVRSACQAFSETVQTARRYGGAVSNRVSRLLKPSVATTDGKKLVTPPDETIPVAHTIKSQVLVSLSARKNPWKKVCCALPVQSSRPTSSLSRMTA